MLGNKIIQSENLQTKLLQSYRDEGGILSFVDRGQKKSREKPSEKSKILLSISIIIGQVHVKHSYIMTN